MPGAAAAASDVVDQNSCIVREMKWNGNEEE